MKAVAKRAARKTANVPEKIERAVKAARGVAAVASVDPQALLAQAIDRNLPIESMERLLAMRKDMKAEWARDQFFAALTGFQHECPSVEKRSKVPNKKKEGEPQTYRYSYAPLEDIVDAVKPFLEKWGFSWTVKPKQTDGHVQASCYAHHKDGHEEVTEFSVPLDPESYMSNPQRAAAALTFARRYAFINAFGIVTKGEDNDAREEDEPPRRRAPIQEPRAQAPANGAAVPVHHEEKKPLGDFEKVALYLSATETDPKTKAVVRLFSDNEVIDYTSQANQAKGKPEELKIILDDITKTGAARRRAVKGDRE